MKSAIALLVTLLSLPSLAADRWVAGYYVGYQSYLYPQNAVDFDNLTHLIVGRVIPQPDGSLDTKLDIDAEAGPALARELAKLARAKGKKAILFVGGAGEYEKWQAAAAPANRAKFVKTLVETMDSWGYDGLDLDWEPIKSEDGPSLLALVQELRKARPGAILSIPVAWINPNWEKADPLFVKLAPLVDRINLMTYSMSDAWTLWRSWHSSALHSESMATPSSVSSSVAAFVALGIPKEKIGIGAGFYGSCWAGGVTGPGQATGGSSVVASDNEMSFTNIMKTYFVASAYRFDEKAAAPYLSFPSGHGPQRCSFLSYEDERSLALKGAYIKKEGLGGVVIWTINQGYLPTASEKNPLLRSLYRAVQ